MSVSRVIYSDVDRNLALDGQGNIKILLNEQAVLSSLQNILETYIGQRGWDYTFGSTLYKYLFEDNANNIQQITNEIVRVVQQEDPRPKIEDLKFYQNKEVGTLRIQITVSIRGLEGLYTTNVTAG